MQFRNPFGFNSMRDPHAFAVVTSEPNEDNMQEVTDIYTDDDGQRQTESKSKKMNEFVVFLHIHPFVLIF